MQKTYHGTCHCGAIGFEADIDLTQGASRCNCSFCTKTRNWSARIAPQALRFTRGAEIVRRYDRLGGGVITHAFCPCCGVRLVSEGDLPELGGAFVTVMLSVLDNATPEELIAAPLVWCDGRADNWWQPPAETRHL